MVGWLGENVRTVSLVCTLNMWRGLILRQTSNFSYSMVCTEYRCDYLIIFLTSSLLICVKNDLSQIIQIDGTEAETQLPLKRSSRFQRLFPNPSWLVWGRASRYQKLAPTFPGIDSCLMVTKWDFLEASLCLNGKSQNVAKGWLST